MWILKGKLEIISVVYAVSVDDFVSSILIIIHTCSTSDVAYGYYLISTSRNMSFILDTGNGGISLVLRRDVMVCQTQGSSLHISIHPLHTDRRGDFRLLHLS